MVGKVYYGCVYVVVNVEVWYVVFMGVFGCKYFVFEIVFFEVVGY